MEPTELALCSTQDLVKELARRQTFLGVVVHSEAEWRGGDWGDERTFKVHFNANLTTEQASRLLSRVADYLGFHTC